MSILNAEIIQRGMQLNVTTEKPFWTPLKGSKKEIDIGSKYFSNSIKFEGGNVDKNILIKWVKKARQLYNAYCDSWVLL